MRKFNYLIALLLMAILNTACAQNSMIQSVTFKSNTRGGQKMITVNESSVSFTNGNATNKNTMESADWKKLVKICDEIDLHKVESYDPPSEGRARDAAWHSTLTFITEDGSEYSTVSFDNAKSPKKLDKVMSFLMDLDKKFNADNPVLDY